MAEDKSKQPPNSIEQLLSSDASELETSGMIDRDAEFVLHRDKGDEIRLAILATKKQALLDS